MSENYEEIIAGESIWRRAPGAEHETICERLHLSLFPAVAQLSSTELLPPRAPVELGLGHWLRPDLTLLTRATRKPWLIAEIIDSRDHHTDTVAKKAVYEDLRLPRLWMVDPRYQNVEVYHGTPHGLSLVVILALRDTLTEPLLPGFALKLAELFEVSG